jgi:lipopolysaccharide export LptBFGC system permease protein LptF
MAAAQACGVGVGRVAAAVWLLALPVTALIVLLNFELAPRAAAAEAPCAMRRCARRHGAAGAGQISQLRRWRIVVYARAADPQRRSADVFVKRSDGAVIETTVAQRAHYSLSSDGRERDHHAVRRRAARGHSRQHALSHHALR